MTPQEKIQQLKDYIKTNGITLKHVSVTSGLTESTLNRVFSGAVEPTFKTVFLIAQAVNLDVVFKSKNLEI
jgi:transcriptional regulator with XRE-family HTH domain